MNYIVEIWNKATSINDISVRDILEWVPRKKDAETILIKDGNIVILLCEIETARRNLKLSSGLANEEVAQSYLDDYLRSQEFILKLPPLELKRKEVLQAIADRDKGSEVFYVQFGDNKAFTSMYITLFILN